MLLFSKKIVSVFQNLHFRQVKPMLLHCKTAAFALQLINENKEILKLV
ncbi:hypothetical protein HMPREF0653_02372 [Prevotella disiens JCM 6334 = ATCC 29426]|uniref:Uncharacterized protein n=1 Tax=Prevotella disiens JCM 6334 = ATCC 29426 TaxID=1235811 RepID=A0ABN0NPH1_9BACT|nr:hypothetical protein HMPREF0653_02372 [Prevotella disiens JCM 6334 = ATCC 29426]